MLQREIAAVIVQGELRDPRLRPSAAISITGVEVSPDLSRARVFIDVLGEHPPVADVLAALDSGAAAVRARVSRRVRLKRVPSLKFFRDESIEKGVAIERVLAEIRDSSAPAEPTEPEPDGEPDEGDDPDTDA
jgi:ribosome-binding factor A